MELRVILLAYLRPRPDSVVWDVGGGTGALALEIARLLPGGRVQALERDPEALELLERNGPLWHPKSRGVCRSGAR